jgi:solute carrier family 25 uncoupling protein 27
MAVLPRVTSAVASRRVAMFPCSLAGKGLLYKGTMDCLTQAVRKEGVMTLYKGWLPNWMRMAPWSLVFFLSFEQMRRLGNYNDTTSRSNHLHLCHSRL